MSLPPPERVSWSSIIDDLSAAGLGMKRLAKELGVGWSTVRGWKRGSEPSHADGERVLRIWAERTGRERTTAPREQWFGRMQRLFR